MNINAIVVDFETRSRCDLKQCGAVVYARHESTEILCLALYDLATDESIVYDPYEEDMPKEWFLKVTSADLIMAHNALFDREIWRNCMNKAGDWYPVIEDARWYCTSAQARVNALPASLEDAAIAAGLQQKKDFKGAHLIKKLSIPQKDGTFNEDPKLMRQMMDYCLQDVVTTVELVRNTRLMTQVEHNDWLITETMNMRGVRVDVELAELAQQYAEEEQAGISAELERVTGGVITKATQHQRIKKYILESLDMNDPNDQKLESLMTVYKGGEKKHSTDKNVRESVITAIDNGVLELYEDIEELIRLLDAASMASVAKFKRMQSMACADDRVRGAFVFAGASQTHRFASKGLQLHNMKRDCFNADMTEDIKAEMKAGTPMKNVMTTLSKLLRPALIPDYEKAYVVGDWSAIEGRALPWLSNDPRAEKVLDIFRNDEDLYIQTAVAIGLAAKPEDVSDDLRQIGKVIALSLGYGGAVGAFNAMGKNYGVILPEHQVERLVKRWRNANPWAVKFWGDCMTAAKRAVRARGKKRFTAGRVTYTFAPDLLGGTLICMLPDGTAIQYPQCRTEHSDRGDNLTALKAGIHPKAGESEWGRVRLWGGLLVENITQAFCGGLLRDKLRTLDEEDNKSPYPIPVVAHVHDEIILEVDDTYAEDDAKFLKEIMEEVPPYATGLPLKAEPVVLRRYGNH